MADESTEELVKVYVDLPNHWAVGGEAMWARPMGGDVFQLKNVPFHAYGLNYDDLVVARSPQPDLKPHVERVASASGHRTLRIILLSPQHPLKVQRLLARLANLRVDVERADERLLALDIPPDVSLDHVTAYLGECEADGILEYETCQARIPGSFDDDPAE